MSEKLTQWTKPFYLLFLGGNFVTQLKGDEQAQFIASVNKAMKEIDDETIADLLSAGNWRPRLAGAWFSGLTGRTQFQNRIGALLVETSYCYSGQGYCFALAACATAESSEWLRLYLDKWLLRPDCYFDQDWAIAALDWVDKQRRTEHHKTYLQPGGLWEKFTADKPIIDGYTPWNFDVATKRFTELMEFSNEHFGPARN